MADFHFDFEAIQGLTYEEGLEALMKQMEDHYNANFKPQQLVFGGSRASGKGPIPMVPAAPKTPDTLVAPPPLVKPEPVGPVDTETVTAKTIDMKSFSIKDGKELGLKEGDTIIKGITSKGVEVFDKLLPGYDQMPYGPVVQGESGRYNLKPKGK